MIAIKTEKTVVFLHQARIAGFVICLSCPGGNLILPNKVCILSLWGMLKIRVYGAY
jgi:hypothetical protein